MMLLRTFILGVGLSFCSLTLAAPKSAVLAQADINTEQDLSNLLEEKPSTTPAAPKVQTPPAVKAQVAPPPAAPTINTNEDKDLDSLLAEPQAPAPKPVKKAQAKPAPKPQPTGPAETSTQDLDSEMKADNTLTTPPPGAKYQAVTPPPATTKPQVRKAQAKPQSQVPAETTAGDLDVVPQAQATPAPAETPQEQAQAPVPESPASPVAPSARKPKHSRELILTEDQSDDQDQDDDNAPPEIEGPRKGITSSKKLCNCKVSFVTPYRDRRSTWGFTFGLEYGNYVPTNYQPEFASTQSFDSYYTGTRTGEVGFSLGAKYNFFLGSIGPELSLGYFQAVNKSSGSILSLIPIEAGIKFALDILFSEPWVVPYVVAGVYSVIYHEQGGSITVQGNSGVSPYIGVGVQIKLDSLDQEAHDFAYAEYGLENTFIYFEGRSLQSPMSSIGPDLSDPLYFIGGLKVEF